MVPLIVLLASFLALFAMGHYFNISRLNLRNTGNLAMTTMLILTGVSHFYMTLGMTMMLPDFLPFKTELVYLTGLFELLAAIGLLFEKLRRPIGILLMIFFILILPANVFAAINHINISEASINGHGLSYLWFRIPLQLLFIGWVWFFSIRRNKME